MIGNNFLKQKLEAGKAVIGTWAVIPSVITTDIIASTGLDFLIIDSEHGPISFEKAQEMAIACEAHGVSPVMRVGEIDEAAILKAMDIGMHCLQIPNVDTPEKVKEIVRYSKYSPVGNRGFSPFTRAGAYSIENAGTLPTTANDNTLLAINIEGRDAISNIDRILEIPELDIIFIGLYDLSKALDIPGQVNDCRLLEQLETITQKCNRAGKYCGSITTSKDTMKTFVEMGLKYIVHLVDCEMLRQSYTNITSHFRDIADE